MNSRLDELQAAVLRARLAFLPGWTARRRELARQYRRRLADVRAVTVPPELDTGHVYHLFPVRSAERDAAQSRLRAAGIETFIHYPVPVSRQPAVATERPGDCPVADRVCDEVFSLPLYPALPADAIDRVAAALARPRSRGHRTTPRTPAPAGALCAHPRRAVRCLRGGASHVGQLGGRPGLPGIVRERPRCRLPPEAGRRRQVRDRGIRYRDPDQLRGRARRRRDRREAAGRTAHPDPGRLARPVGAGAVPPDIR